MSRLGVALGLACLCALGQAPTGYPYIVRTFAGTFPLGEGGPATSALLQNPNGVAVDSAGNLHILDSGNARIRRVDSKTGTINAIAAVPVTAADFRLALDEKSYYVLLPNQLVQITPAASGQPAATKVIATGLTAGNGSIAIDKNGDIYVAEPAASRVRKVKVSDGTLQPIAGTGTAGYSGDGGPATAAQLGAPQGIAYDASSGIVYVADTGNRRIRKIASDGTMSTIAGTGTQGRPVDGPALQSPLATPVSLAVDGSGGLIVADGNNNAVLRVGSDGSLARIGGDLTPFGSYDNGPALSRSLYSPNAVTTDATGNVYVTDDTFRVRRIGKNGQMVAVAGQLHFGGDGGPASAALLNLPRDLVADTKGNWYIADALNYRIRRVSPDGTISTYAGNGDGGKAPVEGSAISSNQPIGYPYALAYDPKSDALYIATAVRVIKIAGGVYSVVAGGATQGDTGDGGPATQATFRGVYGIAVDGAGNLYVADGQANRIRKISAADGTISAFAGTGTRGFSGDGGPALSAQLALDGNSGYAPLTVDARGNVYIGDVLNNRVRVVTSDGTISTFAGTGTAGAVAVGQPAKSSPLINPIGLATDASGTVYIDAGGIFAVGADGIIRRISGGGPSPVADGDVATAVDLTGVGLRVDVSGDVYTAGFSSNIVHKLVLNSPSGLSVNDGDGQSAPVTWPLPKALKARVDGRGGVGVPGIGVSFAGVGAALSATSAQTDATGVASVTATLGASAGTATITASSTGFAPVQFKETATGCSAGAPTVTSANSLSDFGGMTTFAAGSWLEIKGTNLSSVTRLWSGADFTGLNAPTILEGTKIQINGKPGYIVYVSPTQVNVQAPADTAVGPVQIGVTNCSVLGASTTLTKAATAPGFLAPASFNVGKQYLVALFQDGVTYVGPVGLIPGVPFRPAKPGDTITTYGIGFGPVSGTSAPGTVVTQSNSLPNFALSFGATPAKITYAGLAGGNIGLYQFNIVVPQVADGDYAIQATLGGSTVPQQLFLSVKN